MDRLTSLLSLVVVVRCLAGFPASVVNTVLQPLPSDDEDSSASDSDSDASDEEAHHAHAADPAQG